MLMNFLLYKNFLKVFPHRFFFHLTLIYLFNTRYSFFFLACHSIKDVYGKFSFSSIFMKFIRKGSGVNLCCLRLLCIIKDARKVFQNNIFSTIRKCILFIFVSFYCEFKSRIYFFFCRWEWWRFSLIEHQNKIYLIFHNRFLYWNNIFEQKFHCKMV